MPGCSTCRSPGARDLDQYLLRVGKLNAVSLEGASVGEIWRHNNAAFDVASDYFQPNIAISITGRFLHRMLHALVSMAVGPERGLSVVDGLLAGCDTKTAQVNREIHDSRAARHADPGALEQLLLGGDSQKLWKEGGLSRFPEFLKRFRQFLEDHGHREIYMDYYHPTWSGQPWVVLDSIVLLLRAGVDEDPLETARAHRQCYSATENQFLAAVPESLQFFFRELIRLARTYTVLDDLEHYQTTRINGIARRAAVAIGARLERAGILEAAEDVFFLQKEDLDKIAAEFPNVSRRFIGEKRLTRNALMKTPCGSRPLGRSAKRPASRSTWMQLSCVACPAVPAA